MMQIPENIQNFVREEFDIFALKIKLFIRTDMIESSEFPHLVNTNAAISKATLMSFPLVGNLSEKPRRIADRSFRDNDRK